MKSTAFSRHLETELAALVQKETVTIKRAVPAHGGSINECFVLETTEGKFFLKRNDAQLFPGMFEAEMKGLKLLSQAGKIKIPQPYFCGIFREQAYFVTEFVRQGLNTDAAMEIFGAALAEMHKHSHEHYGLDHNNYIGSLPQRNKNHEQWSEFFIYERLKPMADAALEKSLLDRTLYDRFEKLYARIEHFFPVELPALLHGDLWSGNFFISDYGLPVMFDPAAYYGHREMDIAMTLLFGGFQKKFYDAYNNAWPLENGWRERADVCNLYPLLVHVNLFGAGYVKQVELIVRKYVG